MATHPSQTDLTSPGEPPLASLPPLEQGDSLTRSEFERRYEAMPWLKKAELIDGVVHLGSAVYDQHAGAHAALMHWFGSYTLYTPGTVCRDNATVRLDMLNELQPDALVRIVAGGQSRVDKYIEGPPELVAEVASSSVSRDLHSKLAVYRRHGVREYLVWRVLEGDVDWYRLDGGEYRSLAADDRGIFRSREFAGLWLDRPALLRGDMHAVLAVLNEGLATSEHAEFVARLAGRA
jgi:Uma2 family endonuclease